GTGSARAPSALTVDSASASRVRTGPDAPSGEGSGRVQAGKGAALHAVFDDTLLAGGDPRPAPPLPEEEVAPARAARRARKHRKPRPVVVKEPEAVAADEPARDAPAEPRAGAEAPAE